uniref:Uncharacterized protein n=1 Tax=viral metagenome TaxID=1070528 RepID=A0A6C0B8N0_9ZZZZ
MKTKKRVKNQTKKRVTQHKKSKKQKGGRLRCSTIDKGKWVAMSHNDPTVHEYRECEARFMNMLQPSIPCSDANVRDLYTILQNPARIIAAFSQLEYQGQRRVLVNLERAIELRSQRSSSDGGHIAFLRNEEALYPVLEGLLKPRPIGTPDKTWDDVDNIDSELHELRTYMSQLQDDGIFEGDESVLADVRSNISRLETKKIDLYKRTESITEPNPEPKPVIHPKVQTPEIVEEQERIKLEKLKSAQLELQKKEDAKIVEDAELQKAIEKAKQDSALVVTGKHYRYVDELQSPPFKKVSGTDVQFLPSVIEERLKPCFEHYEIVNDVKKFEKLRGKSTSLTSQDFSEYKRLQNSIFNFTIVYLSTFLFEDEIYKEKHFLSFLTDIFFFTKTTPPYLISTMYENPNVILHIPKFYKSIYLIVSHFSRHELSITPNTRIFTYFIDDYLYMFHLFLTLFNITSNPLLTKMKRLVEQCIRNINENKPTQNPRFVPVFMLPEYTIQSSLSIESSPLFHEIMNAKLKDVLSITLPLSDELKAVIRENDRLKVREIVERSRQITARIIPDYLNTFVTSILPGIKIVFKEFKDTKDDASFVGRMLPIIDVFLTIFKDLCTATLSYSFNPAQITDFDKFLFYLSVFLMNLQKKIEDGSPPPYIYLTYVKLFHFIYYFTNDNKKHEKTHIKTFYKAINFIFKHDL